jgi:transglutaminase-like putative cysteine protease
MQRYGEQLREDWLSLGLLLLLMLAAGWSVTAADRGVEGLDILLPLVAIGVIFSYLVAVSAFGDGMAALMAVLVGCFVTWAMAGQLIEGPYNFRERLFIVTLRAGVWLNSALIGGRASGDNLVFVTLVCLLGWYLAFNAAWHTFRLRRLWWATVPAGLAMVLNAFYYFGPARLDLLILVYVFLTLVLAVETNTINRVHLWQRVRASFRPSVRGDLLRGGLVTAVVLLAAVWLAPVASASDRLYGLWSSPDNPWLDVERTFDRLFSNVQGRPVNTPTYYAGSTLGLSGAVDLSDTPVMRVNAPQGHHYYWRSKAFDRYDSGQWRSEIADSVPSDFGTLWPETAEPYRLRENVQQRFTILMPGTRLLYAAPQPASFGSIPLTADLIYTAPGDEVASVMQVTSREVIASGESYIAISSVTIADEVSLRHAGTDYPAWVRERYVNLPVTITPRTKRLAETLAAPHSNPYDIARAVEAYLRSTIAYNEQVDAPPSGAEPVDYVLFESQEGYCTYYATAMAVILRSQGIPARVAAGFAQGTYDAGLAAYVVLESDAHAWVEVFFPGYGWVEFEPTASRDPVERLGSPAGPEEPVETEVPLRETPIAADETELPATDQPADVPLADEVASVTPPGAGLRVPVIVRWGLGLLAGLALAVIAAWYWLEQRGLGGLGEVARSYARLNMYAPLVDLHLEPGDTPHERAAAYRDSLPDARIPVSKIVELYVQEQYAPGGLPAAEGDRAGQQARQAWQTARRVLLRAIFRRRVGRNIPFRRRTARLRR